MSIFSDIQHVARESDNSKVVGNSKVVWKALGAKSPRAHPIQGGAVRDLIVLTKLAAKTDS